MTLHVCVLGIDGSGKSTVAASLPVVLSAECGVIAGFAGEDFRIAAAAEDLLAPSFHPGVLPLSARLARRLKRRAKELVDDPKRYPLYKIGQMLLQDAAARALAVRHGADVMVSDGNTLLSATGRAGNYRRPASEGMEKSRPVPGVEDLAAVFRYVLEREPLPEASVEKLPSLERVRTIQTLLRIFRLDAVWLPHVVVFLDLSPEKSIERIQGRGAKVDRHENVEDLRQARKMYRKTLEAYRVYCKDGVVIRVDVDGLVPGQILEKTARELREVVLARRTTAVSGAPLGTTTEDLSARGLLGKVLNFRYLFGYLFLKWFDGAWREPLFALSAPGRKLLKEGYSAGVMRVIYDANGERQGFGERVFHEYPLHRAVYDRLQILTAGIEPELESRLATGAPLRLFSAPSGFAYDLFRPLEAIASRRPEAMKRIRFLAADLDPYHTLEKELGGRARALGIDFRFVRGDLTSEEIRSRFTDDGPFDVALFVGLSSWIPKPDLVRHLRFVREQLKPEGVLVSDSFTAAAFALSGKYVGYRAHYYDPAVYKALADFCGFDGTRASLQSGRDRINHVMMFRPRPHRG